MYIYKVKKYFVYIISNKYRSTFYIGMTGNLQRRIFEHKAGKGGAFSSKYKVTDLLYFEEYSKVAQAIYREKQLKRWHRPWKINLIKELNPSMIDLAADWFSDEDIAEYRDS